MKIWHRNKTVWSFAWMMDTRFNVVLTGYTKVKKVMRSKIPDVHVPPPSSRTTTTFIIYKVQTISIAEVTVETPTTNNVTNACHWFIFSRFNGKCRNVLRRSPNLSWLNLLMWESVAISVRSCLRCALLSMWRTLSFRIFLTQFFFKITVFSTFSCNKHVFTRVCHLRIIKNTKNGGF